MRDDKIYTENKKRRSPANVESKRPVVVGFGEIE